MTEGQFAAVVLGAYWLFRAYLFARAFDPESSARWRLALLWPLAVMVGALVALALEYRRRLRRGGK